MEKAINIDSSFIKSYAGLINYYWLSGQFEKADSIISILQPKEKEFTEWERNQFSHIDIDELQRIGVIIRFGSAGRAYNEIGDFERTIQVIDEYFPKSSDYSWAYWMKIRAHANLGQADETDELASRKRGAERVNQHLLNHVAAWEYYLLQDKEMVRKFARRALEESGFER